MNDTEDPLRNRTRLCGPDPIHVAFDERGPQPPDRQEATSTPHRPRSPSRGRGTEVSWFGLCAFVARRK